jgi:fucose permease
MFALGRLLAVSASRRVSVYRIVVGACTSTVVVLTFMLVARGQEWAVWVGAGLFGLAAAPQYPTMFAFVDTRAALPARATAAIVSASATGALVVPAAIGALIDRYGPSSMPAVVLVVSAGTIVGAMVVNRTTRDDVTASSLAATSS